jgi:hypothetical protein
VVGAPGVGKGASAPMPIGAAGILQPPSGDVFAELYATLSNTRDQNAERQTKDVKANGVKQKEADKAHADELRKAKEAAEDTGPFGFISAIIDAVVDAVMCASPVGAVLKAVSEITKCKAFEVISDIVRPDAILNGAVMLAAKVTDCPELKQAYDMVGLGSSMKERFAAAAELTGCKELNEVYQVGKQVAMAVVGAVGAVFTAGASTALIVMAVVSASISVASIIESKLGLLEKLGVSKDVITGIRIGAAAAQIACSVGGLVVGAASAAGKAGELSRVGKDLNNATNAVKGAQAIGDGARIADKAITAHNVAQHEIAADAQKIAMKQIDRQIDKAVANLKELASSYQNAALSLRDSMEADMQSRHQIAGRYM